MQSQLTLKVSPKVRISVATGSPRLRPGSRGVIGGGTPAGAAVVGAVTLAATQGVVRALAHRNASASRADERLAAVAAERAAAEAAEMAEAEAVQRRLFELVTYHHEAFPAAEPPTAAPVPPVPVAAIEARRVAAAVAGIGAFERARRREVTAEARRAAQEEAWWIGQRGERERAKAQAALDEQWKRLCAGEEDAIIDALEAAFADNAAPAVPVGVEGDRAVVVVVVESDDAVPDKRPVATDGGALKLQPWPKPEAAQFYAAHVGSHVLATVREGFAVVPNLQAITIVVVRRQPDEFGLGAWADIEALYVGTFPRDRWASAAWTTIDPASALEQADEVKLRRVGRSRRIAPLPRKGDVAVFLDQFAASLHRDEASEAPAPAGGYENEPAVPQGAPPQAPPPGWLADPTERFQYRWWDGSEWSDAVATGAERGEDPFDS